MYPILKRCLVYTLVYSDLRVRTSTMPSYDYKNLPIGTIYNFIVKGRVDTNPSYQRDIVWNEAKQKSLVDTLLTGFPMPSINFVENNDPSLPQYECMDGKNRLKAIEKYMKDDLVVQGGVFSELSDDLQDDFRAINVQVCVFKNLSYEHRREYFRRIQEGVSLNQTEIVWSYEDRPLIVELRKIREHVLDSIDVLWETSRYSDMTLLCNIAAMVMGKNIAKDSAGHSTSLTNWVKKSASDQNYVVIGQAVKKVIRRLVEVLTVQPNSKAKPWVILDLSRVIVHREYKKINIDTVERFITELDRYMLHGDEPDIVDVVKYAAILRSGASSHMYTAKIIEARYEVVKNLF